MIFDNLYFELFFLNLVVSIFINYLILITIPFHINHSSDNRDGPQKIHEQKVPRIGDLSIAVGFFLSIFILEEYKRNFLQVICISSIPILFIGILEDIKKNIKPKVRLFFAFISSWLIVYLSGYSITSVDLKLIDEILDINQISILLTILSIAAFSNAINIIDGLNGLALGSVIFMLLTINILSIYSGDQTLIIICSVMIGLILGLFIYNFPYGKIFLGDGGAYFLGFLIAFLVIILSERNETISPFISLLIIFYPFYETVRSFVRRISKGFRNTMQPDTRHFHSLAYKYICEKSKIKFLSNNVQASILCMMFTIFNCVWTLVFFQSLEILIIGIFLFIFIYEFAYRKFKLKIKS